MLTPPDQSCRTGGGVGHDVWIWECYENRRVVIYQYCGGFVGCRPAEREETACGGCTPFERSHAEYLAPCRPVPEGQRWLMRGAGREAGASWRRGRPSRLLPAD